MKTWNVLWSIRIQPLLLRHSKLSSGASNFLWSSLRCLYNLIGVHLWPIQLIWQDLERNTPFWIRSHGCSACQSRNSTTKSKKLSIELWDRVVRTHRSGEGYKTISRVLKVPKNTVSSIRRKLKEYRTTQILRRAGCLTKLSNQARRTLSGGDQEPDDHSDRTTELFGCDGRTCQKDNTLCSTSQI